MEPEPLQQLGRTYVLHRGRKLSYFGGCDYFRMSSHPRMRAAMVEGLRRYGANVSASRLTTGNHKLYAEVEAALRDFFKAEAALVVSNGYATNLIVAQALAGEFTRAFIDARAHVSLKDASRMLGCAVTEFGHRDAAGLARAMKRAGGKGRLVVLTDGMFAHDGETAPLARYLEVLPGNAVLMVDDAHGAGLVGKNGRGTPELKGVTRKQIVQTITLSKAFGAYGGAILGSRDLRERMVARSGMFAGSTPPPLPLMNAALEGLRLLGEGSDLRRRLAQNVAQVKDRLRGLEGMTELNNSPIIPVVARDGRHAKAVGRALRARDIFASLIKYPGSPADGYYRLVISSEHTKKQLDDLTAALTACYA